MSQSEKFDLAKVETCFDFNKHLFSLRSYLKCVVTAPQIHIFLLLFLIHTSSPQLCQPSVPGLCTYQIPRIAIHLGLRATAAPLREYTVLDSVVVLWEEDPYYTITI